jgi:hypothetical protein
MDGLTRLSVALDELADERLDDAPATDLPSRLIALQRAASRLHAELLRTTERVDRSGEWERDGAVSAAAWLRRSTRISEGAAREQVRTARVLAELLPRTAAALAAGEINTEHVRVISRAAAATPQREASIPAAESTLVEAARRLPPRQLGIVVGRWADAVDPAAAITDAECAFAARRLSISPTLGGLVALDGLLDPESGATVLTAIQALAAPSATGSDDDRSPSQRRADALVELSRRALDAGNLPDTGGDRPHLLITINAGQLGRQRDAGRAGSLIGAVRDWALPPGAAERLGCDATISPVLLGGSSSTAGSPVDIGRTTRVVPPRLRRLIAVRDGGCRFPGCDRPLAWCDAHHVTPWSQGGRTDRDNLLMLCRRHHRAVHEGGFTLLLDGAAVTVYRPDGTALAIRERPPPWSDTG